MFLSLSGELEGNPRWSSLQPPPSIGLVGGTALLSKQLLGLEASVVDPVKVRSYSQRLLFGKLYGV